MTLFSQTPNIGTRHSHPERKISPLRTLLIWNDAWRELQRLRRLDAEALNDMGITCAERDAITLRQIVDRMRR